MENLIENQNIGSAEVMELILSHLDVARLKICRLVCRSWNVQACSVLRKKSVALTVDSTKTFDDEFSEIVERSLAHFRELSETGKSLELPTPFRDLGICLRKKELPYLLKYAVEYQPRILQLKLFGDVGNEDVVEEDNKKTVISAFKELLKYCSGTVELLTFEVSVDFRGDTSLTFPCLKELHLPSQHDPATPSAALFVILINSAPNLIKISCTTNEMNVAVLQVSDLRKIKELELKDVRRYEELGPIKGLGMPMLESLMITFPQDWEVQEGDSESATLFLELIAKYSLQLRKLAVDAGMSSIVVLFQFSELPVCPVLTELHVTHLVFEVGDSILEKFPALKSLSVYTLQLEDPDELDEDIVPFMSLETFRFEYINSTNFGTRATKQLQLETVEPLCPRFPNAICWEVSSWFVELLHHIARAGECSFDFYRIEKLKIIDLDDVVRGSFQEEEERIAESLSGLRHLKALKHLEINPPFPQASLLNLIDLECVPSLESFSFLWNDGLEMDVMADKLKDIKTVFVLNCCDYRHSKAIEKLFIALPRAQCGCRQG